MTTTKNAFYRSFGTLKARIKSTQKELEQTQEKIETLEKRLETQQFTQDTINGLRTTRGRRDPGKHSPAFYFAKTIGKDNIQTSYEPKLHHPCPSCNQELPVVVIYCQTDDSPEGDTWEKKAFTICPDGTYHELAAFYRSDRF